MTKSAIFKSGDTYYINALGKAPATSCATGATLVNRRTGEEVLLDVLTEDPTLATFLRVIRDHFGAEWGVFETWPIEAFAPIEEPLAA